MLSISGPIGGGGSVAYYLEMAEGEYYTGNGEAPGQWFGGGTSWLKLTGGVKPRQFQNLLEGRSPDGTRKLVQNAGHPKRQKGWDQTFSAPKSVSVLWAFASPEIRAKIEAAQRRAVETALRYLETKAGLSRRGQGGRVLEAAGLVFATFLETVSRALEPQLHSHAVLANLGIRRDGTTGALWSQEFFRQKMRAGAIYRAQAAVELELSLGLRIEPCRIGFHLVGVPKELCRAFSKGRQAIEKKLDQWGDHSALAAKTAALVTRKTKQHVPREQLQAQWQGIAQAYGWSATQATSLIRPGRSQRAAMEQLLEAFANAARKIPVAKRTAKALLVLAERLAIEFRTGAAGLQLLIEQYLPGWVQAAGNRKHSDQAQSRRRSTTPDVAGEQSARKARHAEGSGNKSNATGSGAHRKTATKPQPARTAPAAAQPQSHRAAPVKVQPDASRTEAKALAPQSQTRPPAAKAVKPPTSKAEQFAAQLAAFAARAAEAKREEPPVQYTEAQRRLLAYAKVKGLLKEGVTHYWFDRHGHLLVSTEGELTAIRARPAVQPQDRAVPNPKEERRLIQLAKAKGWLKEGKTDHRFSPEGVLWVRHQRLRLALSALPPPHPAATLARPPAAHRKKESRLLAYAQAQGILRDGQTVLGFDSQSTLWVKDKDLTLALSWRPWAQAPSRPQPTKPQARATPNAEQQRRLIQQAFKWGLLKDPKTAHWSEAWQGIVVRQHGVESVIPWGRLRQREANTRFKQTFQEWAGRMHPENQTRERLQRLAYYLGRRTGADKETVQEVLQTLRPGAEKGFFHWEWHPLFPKSPFRVLRDRHAPVLEVGRPPHKWDRILWAGDIKVGQLRLQMRRLFPRATRWNPVQRWALPALRLTQERAKVPRQQPKPQAQAKPADQGRSAAQGQAMEHGY